VLYELQTRKLIFLQREHKEAVARLSKRLVEIYTSERTSSLSVVLDSGSFSDMLDQLEFLSTIGQQDHKIANEVESAKLQMQETRNSTRKTRRQVAETTAAVAARTAEQRAVRDRLAWSQRELATARRDKRATLASVQEDKEEAIGHMRDLQAQSAALASRIRSAQSSYVVPAPTGAASAAGFVWPVHGVITSGFGWRWGRMHEGVDLAVSNGTPVVAAKAGVVIVAGWMGGYGNLVVVDHGGGVATAYGHNTTVTVGVGQQVEQGQLIAYSGSTGHSTGPHVHFEVRINGSAVDPMGYL
jgi:murein DD-endopeptidase MepM/ murein hydrolase activator NlpD